MKSFEQWSYDQKTNEILEEDLRNQYGDVLRTMLQERSLVDRNDFMKSMSDLYKTGDEELINRAYSLMADMQVEKGIDEMYDEKVPGAPKDSGQLLANQIKKLNITPVQKVALLEGIRNGDAYQWKKVLGKRGKPVALSSIVNRKYKGAAELLPWLVKWKARTGSGGRQGIASTEMFMILSSKNGSAPDKSDVQIGKIKIEVKSYSGSYAYEYTMGQGSGAKYRDEWTTMAENLYKQQGKQFYQKYWKDYEKDKSINKMPLGKSRMKGVGKNHAHLTAPMYSFCYNLQMKSKSKMTATQINKWINDSVRKVFKAKGVPMFKVWDGKKFDRHNFMRLWACCGFEEYKRQEGFNLLSTINQKEMGVITLSSGKDMAKLGESLEISGMDMSKMPGQNGSISMGVIKV